jgi:hypothetical protein
MARAGVRTTACIFRRDEQVATRVSLSARGHIIGCEHGLGINWPAPAAFDFLNDVSACDCAFSHLLGRVTVIGFLQNRRSGRIRER